jgi:hypothetical protein
VPLLLLSIVLAQRGSIRGRVMLIGSLAYFFYVYLMYATMTGINRLFLVYIGIFAAALVTVVPLVINFDIAALGNTISGRFPYRSIIAFSVSTSLFIGTLWLRLSIPVMQSGKFPPEFAGMTTLETQAMDLGLVIPLGLATAWSLARHRPWGYLLAGVYVTFGMVMFIAIPSWIVVPLLQDAAIKPLEAIPFVGISIVGLLLAWRYYSAIGATAGAHRTENGSRLSSG